MRLDVSLQGTKYPMHAYVGGRECHSVNPSQVVKFMARYETAKIVFIIDTHCGDNGRFMYQGNEDKGTGFAACSMPEVGISLLLKHSLKYNTHRSSPSVSRRRSTISLLTQRTPQATSTGP